MPDSITLDAQTLAILSGLIVPVLVGIATKIEATSGLRAVLNFGLSALAGALGTVIANDGALVVQEFIVNFGMTWAISVATYYGIYKPTGVAGSVVNATAGFGLGRPPTMQTDEKGVEDVSG